MDQQIDHDAAVPAEVNPRETWMGVAKRADEEAWIQAHRTRVGVAKDVQRIYPKVAFPTGVNQQEAWIEVDERAEEEAWMQRQRT